MMKPPINAAKSVLQALEDPILAKCIAVDTLETDKIAETRKLARLEERYIYQLSIGCGRRTCQQPWCRSYPDAPKLSPTGARIFASQLATFVGEKGLCMGCKHVWQAWQYAQQSYQKVDQSFTDTGSQSIIEWIKRQRKTNTTTSLFTPTLSRDRWLKAMADAEESQVVKLTTSSTVSKEDIELNEDMNHPKLCRYYIKHITESRLKRAMEICLQVSGVSAASIDADKGMAPVGQRDFTLIEDTILVTFSSPTGLGRAFLANEKEVDDYIISVEIVDVEDDVQVVYHRVFNIDYVQKVYKMFLTMPSSIMMTPMIFATGELALKLSLMQPETLGCLRIVAVLILLEHPMILASEMATTLRYLATTLANMKGSDRRFLIHACLASYDMERLQRLIHIFVDYFVYIYIPDDHPGVDVCNALAVLQLLYETACLSKYTPGILKDFQSQSFSRLVNFRKEYLRWVERRESKDHSIFTLLDWPFLFDVDLKSYFMRVHAMYHMQKEGLDVSRAQTIYSLVQRYLSNDIQIMLENERDIQPIMESHLALELRREHLVQDILDQLLRRSSALHRPLRVKFVNGGEEGLDQGGLQKEMFQVAVQQLFDPDYGMFIYDSDTRIMLFNEFSFESDEQFELYGVISLHHFVGLAFYNGVTIDAGFPLAFDYRLLDYPLTLDLLASMLPRVARSLQQLLDWDQGNVEDVFGLTFSVDVERYGQIQQILLCPDGANRVVTEENRHEFVQLYIQHLDSQYFGAKFAAFKRGFFRVCNQAFVKHLFHPEDFYWALRGTVELDFKMLEANTTYEDGFTADHPVIRHFWQVIHAMTPEQQRKFLRFVTASDRAPPRGLGDVRFSIQRNGPDTDRLPSAYTCFGRLLLPEYATLEKLREKLLIAVENYAGFGLI